MLSLSVIGSAFGVIPVGVLKIYKYTVTVIEGSEHLKYINEFEL